MTLDQLVTGVRRGDLNTTAVTQQLAGLPAPQLRQLAEQAVAAIIARSADRTDVAASVASLIETLAKQVDPTLQALLRERTTARSDVHRKAIDHELAQRGYRA